MLSVLLYIPLTRGPIKTLSTPLPSSARMSQPAPDTIVTQIVQLLAALDVTTISTHQVQHTVEWQ
jgi:hypothetical protein